MIKNKTKKYLVVFAVASVILGSSLGVSAQTISTSSLQAIIQMLQNKINALTVQIQALQQAQTQLQTATSTASISGALHLIAQLHLGDSGDNVKLLQTILASNSDVYPEGIISGYFGRLTSQAVRRFQREHDLEDVGNVGPRTLEKINEELDQHPVGQEEDDNGEEIDCAIVPPGHLIAPGWLRKHEDEQPIIPVCQTLPSSEEEQSGTLTLSSVSLINITSSSADIVWTTNEVSNSKIWYSGVSPISTAGSPQLTSESLAVNHDISLSGLMPNTTYYFVVGSVDIFGNVSTSTQFSFTTLVQTASAPIISQVSASSMTTSTVHITWTTNQLADSKIWASTSSPVSTSGTPSASSLVLVQNHDTMLSGLSPNTTYYYIVASANASGTVSTSGQFSFITMVQQVAAPVISQVAASNITTSTAHITWTTDTLSDSRVWVSASSPVSTSSSPAVSSGVLVQSHDLMLTGLTPSTTYYYVVVSVDAYGNISTSSQSSFTTLGPPVALSGVLASNITASSTNIVWMTNVAATSKVWYSTSTPVAVGSTPFVSNATLVLNHNLAISGLATSTTYYYLVTSVDAFGNAATSSQDSFVTLSQ